METKTENTSKQTTQLNSNVWCDVALTVGPMYVCLITKMPWKLSFDNLKTPKMCFQFL